MATAKKKSPKGRAVTARVSDTELRGEVAAINRSQAVIQFELDGTVVSANENFLKVLGYTLEEIRGKHHSMFVDPAYRESAEYRAFWDKLQRGEFDAGQFKRIGKGGREVWLQASYNPILDSKGKPVKVVKFATEITEQKLRFADYEGQLNAVSKAQAVIEFNLDGTVITANENFLKVLGYSLDEVKGKHHGMFVETAYRDSAEYRAFWDRLRRGDYESAEFKRIAKGGREVWIQASYNPILDMNGRPFKVVKYATDITEQKIQAQLNAAFKGALDNLGSNVMVADMDLNIIYLNNTVRELMSRNQADFRKDLPNFDASRLLGANIDVFHRNPSHQRTMLAALSKTHTSEMKIGGRSMRITANPMVDAGGKRLGTVVEWADRTVELAVESEIRELVQSANDGNLQERMDLKGKTGVFAEIGSGINQLIDKMSEVVSRAQVAATEVTRGADEISQGNTNLSQRTEEQASSLEETASSMEEMTSTVKQNADNASKASQLATAARDQADKGGAVVSQAIRAMTEINDSSRKIVDIIGVIDEIAFQTNLLALNAAVEAARAGEQGRGFAVVASEVRNLAGRSATAAKEIKGLIQDSVKKVEEGSSLVTQSGQTLDHIVLAVKKVSDIIGEIAGASQEQSAGIEQVNKAVMQLDEMTQQNAALVEEASAASQSMAGQANTLMEMLSRYQVTQEAAAAAASAMASAGQEAPRHQQAKPVRAGAQPAAAAAERRGGARPWAAKDKAAPAAAKPRVAREAVANGADTEWQEF
ncbi:MAG: PAS domain S-box protein [Gammaproteobacteria bacterium]|nr:PAS domain S-box protein [Gammaproteobacteria bacterium]